MDASWDPSGQALAVRSAAAGSTTVLTIQRRTGGILGIGRTSWTIATVSVPADEVSIQMGNLAAGRIVLRVLQREPSCGSLCDDEGALAAMAAEPVFRGYYIVAWGGEGPSVVAWTTTSQQERPPAWVTALDPLAGPAVPAASDAASLPETPSRSDVVAAMGRVQGSVTACGGGAHGVATVQLSVGATGRVIAVTVGGEFAGTAVGSCIEGAIRQVTFAPFRTPTFSFAFPFRI